MSSVKKYIYFLSHKVYEQENIAYLKEKKTHFEKDVLGKNFKITLNAQGTEGECGDGQKILCGHNGNINKI